MKNLLLVLCLSALASCMAGREYVEVYAHADGALTAASDTNHYIIVADGAGSAQLRSAQIPLPIYLHTWEDATVIVGSHDPEQKFVLERGAPLPDEAKAIVLALLTFAEITQAGLTFVTPLPGP
jgi:hypothetical protein